MGATAVRVTAVGTAVAVACAAMLAHAVVATGAAGDVTYLVALSVAIALAWIGVSRTGSTRAGLLAALGMSVSSTGDLTEIVAGWAGAPTDTGTAAWIAAVAYFSGYLLLGAVVVDLLTSPGDRRVVLRADALLEAAALATVGVLTIWTMATIDASGASTTERAVQISAPVADLLLLVFACRVVVLSRGRSRPSWLIAAGAGAWLLTGAGYVVAGSGAPNWLDSGWLLGILLFSLSTFPREGGTWEPTASGAGGSSPHVVLTLLLATIPLGVPPFIYLLAHPDQRALYVPYVGMGVLLLITVIRVGRLLSSEAEARAEVARSRRYFRALADNTVDAILVLDARLEVAFCSRSAETFLGSFPTGTLISRIAQIAPELSEQVAGAIDEAVATPGTVVQIELELAPGRFPTYVHARWIQARIISLLDDADVRGIVMSMSDSTARKEAELELARARDAALEGSRAKSTFLATMSHEIRTPLNGVLGLTELILTTPLDEQQSRYVEGVRVAGGALLQVINDVLDFSKIEAGRLELDDHDFDLVQLLDETAGLVGGPAQEKGLDLVVHCDPNLPRGLRGDHARLRQVLLNLASNAIKFTETGEVQISARLEEPLHSAAARVRFEVVDTGIGIDPALVEHLFDAFTQADSSTTRRFGGTGLGLAICRQLVEAMGGTIGVEPRLGRRGGSRFWFSVPLPVAVVQPSRPRPRTITTAPPAASEPSRGRVLVVEDSEVNQLVAVGILEHLGYAAVVAEDGQEALEMLRSTPFDAVLMDCLMPVMDGYEATAEIRRLGLGGPDLPVIAMTASAVAGDRERCLDAGMNDYVTKPATAAEVAAALERWIPGRRRLAALR